MARGEAELCEVAVDGGGVVGGYGTQDGGKAEGLGEGNLLPVAVCLALDGVLLSVVRSLSLTTSRSVSALVIVSAVSAC